MAARTDKGLAVLTAHEPTMAGRRANYRRFVTSITSPQNDPARRTPDHGVNGIPQAGSPTADLRHPEEMLMDGYRGGSICNAPKYSGEPGNQDTR